jgi:calcium-dependent protein kinase
MDRKTKEWYAIKSIRKSKVNKVEVLKREIQILKEVNHPNIIRLIEVHEDEKYLHLITELCTGGELFDRIIAKTQSPEGHFSERDAANLIRSILDAIAYCHDELQIVHRDLKPENFLFASHAEDAPIKIIDFGLSRHELHPGIMMKTKVSSLSYTYIYKGFCKMSLKTNSIRIYIKVGTPYYVAPEVLKRKYTKSCDIWSIGVITYILLCGYPPFYGDDDAQIFDSVRAGKFDFPSPEWDSISSAAKDFICCLLKKEPEDRLTARQAMNHQWIQTFITPRRSSMVRTNRRRSLVYQNYIAMQKLKKAVLGYIVTHLTPAEIGNLEDLFRRIDKNGDGHMTLEDLDEALGSGKDLLNTICMFFF